jgi:hypothetical protein
MANGYKKIASTAASMRLSASVSSMSLWQGADHLLQVERDHYHEAYRRFYFADIEIFSVRIDKRQWTITFVFGALVGLFVFFAILATGVGRGILLGIAGVFVLPMIYNWLRGPTCVVHLTTAVQREEIASVRRVKGAMRLLQVVQEATAAAQGVMAPDLVRVKFEVQNATRAAAPPPLPPNMAPPPPPLQ